MTSTQTTENTMNDVDLLGAFGATSTRMVDNATVFIPDNRRHAFASEVSHFSALPNTSKRELVLPTEADADLLRAQLRCYARENGYTINLPAEDKFGRALNAGLVLTYRIAPRRSDDNENGEVTVTSVSDAADASAAGADAASQAATDTAKLALAK
jgi:hypothetical protein